MNERLLQFIWQFQYFNFSDLTTTAEEYIQILHPGQHNSNQGPDFLFSKIKIGKTILVGSVELHLKTSDWKKHQHSFDKNYNNVILHVVWENDVSDVNHPILQLKQRVAKILLQRYQVLMQSNSFIACAKSVDKVPHLIWLSWKDRLLSERLIRKANLNTVYLKKNANHWEEIFWWMLAQNFGLKVNAQSFAAIAKSIPINVLYKFKNQPVQLEAILMGQAGLLKKDYKDEYPNLLRKEYNFLKAKFKFAEVHQAVLFLRMRPSNAPTIRLAQLAMLISQSSFLFSKLKEVKSVDEIKILFKVIASSYWNNHYYFDKLSAFQKKKLGNATIHSIIINTVAPMLFLYGAYLNEMKYKRRGILLLEKLAAEKNSITKGFEMLKIANKNSADSQALIELKNEYCNQKRCLECSIGNSILKS